MGYDRNPIVITWVLTIGWCVMVASVYLFV